MLRFHADQEPIDQCYQQDDKETVRVYTRPEYRRHLVSSTKSSRPLACKQGAKPQSTSSKCNRKRLFPAGHVRFHLPGTSLRPAPRQKIVQVMAIVVQLVSDSQLFA